MKHPRQPGVPHPGALVYLCYGSTEPGLKCSQNHQGVARPGGCLHNAAMQSVVSVTEAGFIQGKQLFELTKREVTFHILLLIYHTAAQSLLVALPLKDLFLNCSCLEMG